MSLYQKLFSTLKTRQEGAVVPFVMLMDPDYETSKKILLTLIKAGADAVEVGLPFSDPIADGPVIQRAAIRALKNGSNLKSAMKLIREVKELYPNLPVGLLTYANLVYCHGIDKFYQLAHENKLDSILVADAPVNEAKDFLEAAKKHDIAPVFIAPSNLSEAKIDFVAKNSKAYVYLTTRTGVTGQSSRLDLQHKSLISRLKAKGAAPCLLGFGIHSPAQVQKCLSEGADGVIIGSKIVSIIEENLADENTLLKKLTEFIASVKKC